MATAVFYNWPTPQTQNLQFGWEYGETAASVATGRGFSSPFEGIETGPTAWMPPFYVLLMAGVFKVLGVKSLASLWCLLTLKYAAVAVALLLLLRLAHQSGLGHYRYLLLPALLGPFYLHRSSFFKTLHDPWLHLLLSCVMLYCTVQQLRGGSRRVELGLMVLACLLPLTNPSLALAFLVLQGGVFLARVWMPSAREGAGADGRRVSSSGSAGRRLALLLALFAVSTSIWTYRNYRALEGFIPVKSNLWFDFYQANFLDDDGVPTWSTFMAFNPSHANPTQAEYVAKGEADFTHDYRELALNELRRDPAEWLVRTARRCAAAFLYMRSPDDVQPVDLGALTVGDAARLQEGGLVLVDWTGSRVWLFLDREKEAQSRSLEALDLSSPEEVMREWERAREMSRARSTDWKTVVRMSSVSLVPSLFLVLGFLRRESRRSPFFVVAAVGYLVYLAPYILVSHYERYQLPLIGLQAVFSLFFGVWLLDGLSALAKGRRSLHGLRAKGSASG